MKDEGGGFALIRVLGIGVMFAKAGLGCDVDGASLSDCSICIVFRIWLALRYEQNNRGQE
ncbi:MAG: hypothetical protein AB8B51_10130 [Sedimentitalea sp.]